MKKQKQRLCKICGKPLCIYNKDDICFVHQRFNYVKRPAELTSGCTSRPEVGLQEEGIKEY